MKRLAELAALAIATIAVLNCSAITQQKAQPPHPDDLKFHNLKVLPQNITHDELIATMRGFTRALGVKCGHCHVQTSTAPQPEFDFPSDAKREKTSARIMMRMTRRINHDYISKVEETYTTVSCWTCHSGKTQPDIQPSAQEQPAAPPATTSTGS